MAAAMASPLPMPSMKPLLMWVPSPVNASPSQPSGGWMVRTTGRPCTWAKSQSRWSSAGTAMIAPVP